MTPHPTTIGQRFSYWGLAAAYPFILFMTSAMWFYPGNYEGADTTMAGARPLILMTQALMGAGMLYFYRHTLFLMRYAPLVMALILVILASLFVSLEPKETLAFAIKFPFLALFFGVVALALQPQHLWRLTYWFFAVTIMLNLIYILALPNYGVMSGLHSGAWRGLFSHKNQFSYFAACAVMIFAVAVADRQRLKSRLGNVCLLLIALLMVLWSKSGGALAATAIGLAVHCLVIYRPLIRPRAKAILLAAAALTTLALIPVADTLYAAALELLGKDPTLTNRAYIWDAYLAEVSRSPLLGFGADVYRASAEIAQRISARLGTPYAPSPHNGYIDILMQVGALGLIVYALMAGGILLRAIAKSLRGGTALEKLFLLFLVVHLSRGAVETNGTIIALNLYTGLIVIAYALYSARPVYDRLLPQNPRADERDAAQNQPLGEQWTEQTGRQ